MYIYPQDVFVVLDRLYCVIHDPNLFFTQLSLTFLCVESKTGIRFLVIHIFFSFCFYLDPPVL